MGTLRKEIKRQQEDGILQEENVYIAFWQDRTGWKSYSYRLAELEENEYAICCDDLDRLKEIRGTDSNAILLHCGDFRFIYIDVLESYLVTDILRHYNSKKSPYKIDTVIKEFERKESEEQPPKTLKFNKKRFLWSELGFMLNNCILSLWYSRKRVLACDMKYSYYMQCYDAYDMAVKAILIVLKKCYKVKYNIKITDTECSIVSQDGSDYLFKFEIEENGAYLVEKKV